MKARSPILRKAFQIILVLGVLALALAYWRQRVEFHRLMKEKNRQVEVSLTAPTSPPPDSIRPTEAAPTQSVTPSEEPVAVKPVAVPEETAPDTQQKPAPELVPTPTGMAPAPRADGLTLAGVHAAPIENGLLATMSFNPTTSEPLGVIAIVARIPRNSDGRILDLRPAGLEKYSSVAMRVSEDGKFAVFQGTPEAEAGIAFVLSVSAATVVDVRGTTGIGSFDLSVGPDGASVRPK